MSATADMGVGSRSSFGIALPQGARQTPEYVEELRDACRFAELLGFRNVWVTDHVRGSDGFLEPFSALAFCAAVTRSIRLGVAVAVSAVRSPVHLAQVAASVDVMSGGRLELGLGSGAPAIGPLFGVSPERVFPRFRAGVTLMKELWEQEEVTAEDPSWQLRGVTAGLRPWQRPHPPLWIGARVPSALRFAAEAGTGWIGAGTSSLEDFRRQVAVVREHRKQLGAGADGFGIGKRVYLAVFDGERGHSQRMADVRSWFGHHYGDPSMADRFAVVGSVDECAEQVAVLRQAGAQLVVLNPIAVTRKQMECAAEVADLAGSPR